MNRILRALPFATASGMKALTCLFRLTARLTTGSAAGVPARAGWSAGLGSDVLRVQLVYEIGELMGVFQDRNVRWTRWPTGQCPHCVRHLREDHRRCVQLRVRVGELPRRPIRGRTARAVNCRPPATASGTKPPAPSSADSFAASPRSRTGELAETQRQAPPPGEVVSPT